MSRSGAVRLIPMIGKAEKVSRQTWRLAVVGIYPASWASRPWTNINDWIMSTFQSKKTLISAEPRLVAERIDSTPGMSFMASSIGRVIVAIIWSAGITPLSTRIATRGKAVWGKTEVGSVKAV